MSTLECKIFNHLLCVFSLYLPMFNFHWEKMNNLKAREQTPFGVGKCDMRLPKPVLSTVYVNLFMPAPV